MNFIATSDGTTTTVTVEAELGTLLEESGITGTGQARCRPDDMFSLETGEGIALGRAMQDYGRQVEAEALKWTVTKDEFARVAFYILEQEGL